MGKYNPDRIAPDLSARKNSSGMPAGLLAALVAALLALLGIGTRYYVYRDLNVIHCLFSLFFSINLLICYWEACLFLRRDYIEKRTVYWRRRQRATGPNTSRRISLHQGAVETDTLIITIG